MSLVIRGARILTQDDGRRDLTGDVFIDQGRIVSIGEAKSTRADEVIDARGKLAIPGLVNTHTHLAMSLFRGWGDDLPLDEWLRTRIWPAEDRMKEGEIRAGTKLAALEMVATGTTTFNDMYFFEDAVAEEMASAGLRGWAGWGMVDIGKVKDDSEANPRIPDCEAFVKKWAKHPRVRGAPAPHASYTCGPLTYQRMAAIAEKYDTILHTHVSETRDEVYNLETARRKRPPAYLEANGSLTDRTVAAHCGWITKDEVRQFAKVGTKVAHCPVSNMKLATGGACPVPELLEAGATVGLGTDGAASNNSLDMFETMKFAALLPKHMRWDARVLPAHTVFDLATRGGARALRLESQVGSIEVGKRADVVLVDLARPHLRPVHDPISQLVYAARGSDVFATIVDGEVLKLGDDYRTLKPEGIIDAAEKASARITTPVA